MLQNKNHVHHTEYLILLENIFTSSRPPLALSFSHLGLIARAGGGDKAGPKQLYFALVHNREGLWFLLVFSHSSIVLDPKTKLRLMQAPPHPPSPGLLSISHAFSVWSLAAARPGCQETISQHKEPSAGKVRAVSMKQLYRIFICLPLVLVNHRA